jgi:hypothetical protein
LINLLWAETTEQAMTFTPLALVGITAGFLWVFLWIYIIYRVIVRWETSNKKAQDAKLLEQDFAAAQAVDLEDGGGGIGAGTETQAAVAGTNNPIIERKETPMLEHKVHENDTLAGLIVHYGTDLTTLKRYNDFAGDNFKACVVLLIPSTSSPLVREANPRRAGDRRWQVLVRSWRNGASKILVAKKDEAKRLMEGGISANDQADGIMLWSSTANGVLTQSAQDDMRMDRTMVQYILGLTIDGQEWKDETGSAQAVFYLSQANEQSKERSGDEVEQKDETDSDSDLSALKYDLGTLEEEAWHEEMQDLLGSSFSLWWEDLKWEAKVNAAAAYPASKATTAAEVELLQKRQVKMKRLRLQRARGQQLEGAEVEMGLLAKDD